MLVWGEIEMSGLEIEDNLITSRGIHMTNIPLRVVYSGSSCVCSLITTYHEVKSTHRPIICAQSLCERIFLIKFDFESVEAMTFCLRVARK